MSNATQLAPASANTTPPFLIEHRQDGEDTYTYVSDVLVASSWHSLAWRSAGYVYVNSEVDILRPGHLTVDAEHARRARSAIARTYIAGLKAGTR